jgi:hypothetical protein
MLTSVTPYGLAPLPYWNGAEANNMFPPRQLMQTNGVPLIPGPNRRRKEHEGPSYALFGGKLGAVIASAIVWPALAVAKAYSNQKPLSRLARTLHHQQYPVLFIAALATPAIGFLEGWFAGGLYGFMKALGKAEGGE